MKHRLTYFAALLMLSVTFVGGFLQPLTVRAATPGIGCSPLQPSLCSNPITNKPVPIAKACPSNLSGFPTTQNPNPINTPLPDNTFVQCEITWAQSPGNVGKEYVPGTFQNGSGSGVADYCHRNFTSTYLTSCETGYGDGPGANCGNDKVCAVGAYVRVLLDNSNQNNSTNKPTSPEARSYCDGKKGDAYKACVAGYDGQTAGTSIDKACKAFKGSNLDTCKAAWNQSQSDASNNGSTGPPSCEGGDFSLSWIFCPIINGLSSAVDGIYSNLVQPLLKTKPINLSNPNNDPNHAYAVWSNFRVYGNIFLIIALLVIVFGESIGGGLIDAYTAKKVLPRLLVAAVLINLSIYIVAFAVDITNIVGNGVGALIESPFKTAACSGNNNLAAGGNCFTLNINGSTADIGTAALAGGAIWAAVSLGPLLEFLFLFFLIPAFLTMLAILVTVLLRQGLILFLVLVSPIAFALYCLPNTEQYFRKWWDLLFKTLLIYPIIAIVFALANVLSVTIDTTTSGLTKTFADFLAIIALFVPLFLIPYSFRLAGGVIGQFSDLAHKYRQQAQEGIKGNVNDPTSWRNMTKRKLSNRVLSQREVAVNKGIAMQKGSRSAVGRRVGGSMATVAGLGNYQLRRSMKNKEASDIVQQQVATGDDSSIRSIFSRKMKYRDENGKEREGYFGTGAKRDDNGFVIGATGPQFSDFEVGKARTTAAHDASFYQAALTYEIGKAGDDEELDNIREANAENIKSSPWLRQQSVGIVKGSGFAHVQDRREMKHEDLDVDSGGYSRSSAPFTREVAENVSNWNLGNMRTSTLIAEQDDYKAARAYLAIQPGSGATPEQIQQAHDDMELLSTRKVKPSISSPDEAREIMRHVESTASSLATRPPTVLAGKEGEESPTGQTGSAGHVNQEIKNLIDLAGPKVPPET